MTIVSIRLAGVLTLLAMVGGCTSVDVPPKTIELEYASTPKMSHRAKRKVLAENESADDFTATELWARASLPSDAPCLWVVDGRTRTEYYGWSFPKEQILDWLGEGIAYRLSAVAVPAEAVPAGEPYIHLLKAYIKHVSTTMTSVAVIEVSDGTDIEVFRGNETRLNWGGSDKEFSRILSIALDDALSNIADAPDGLSTCSG